MLAGLRAVFGHRTLVVLDNSDLLAKQAAESHLAVLPYSAVEVASPAALAHVEAGLGSVAIFCSDASSQFQLDMTLLVECLGKLSPGGTFMSRIGGLSIDQANNLINLGLFAGATEPTLHELQLSSGGKCEAWFSCLKPLWAQTRAPASALRIDEDELIGELPKPVGKGKSDCSSQPKACANCTCGRKEMEDKVGAEEAKKKLEQGTVRSSCGSCYLGDAFRCDGCPYRGLPAFKPGSKVELSDGDAKGVGMFPVRESADEDTVATANGKVVIA
jgi:hypothetical protein